MPPRHPPEPSPLAIAILGRVLDQAREDRAVRLQLAEQNVELRRHIALKEQAEEITERARQEQEMRAESGMLRRLAGMPPFPRIIDPDSPYAGMPLGWDFGATRMDGGTQKTAAVARAMDLLVKTALSLPNAAAQVVMAPVTLGSKATKELREWMDEEHPPAVYGSGGGIRKNISSYGY